MKHIFTCILIAVTSLAQAQPVLVAFNNVKTNVFSATLQKQQQFSFASNTNAEHPRQHFENGEAVWYALGIFGGYLVCRTIGRAMAQKDHNWAVAGVGGGLVCLGVTCAIMEHSRRKRVHIAPNVPTYSLARR